MAATHDGHRKRMRERFRISEVAEFYGLPVLDLFSTSGLQPKVDIIKETYMPDGLHPSDAGALRIALRLMGFLQTL